MVKQVTIIQLVILFLVVLAGICKPAAGLRNASSAQYQFSLQASAASQPVNKDGAILLPATDKAIVQAVHFNLAQEFLFVLGFAFSILLTFKVAVFKAPSFSISYFDNTFCHLIAINAP